MLFMRSNIICDDSDAWLFGPTVLAVVVVNALEKMRKDNAVRWIGIRIPLSMANAVHAAEYVHDTCAPRDVQRRCVCAGGFSMLSPEVQPVARTTHEFMSVKLCSFRSRMALMRMLSDLAIAFGYAIPHFRGSEGCANEIEVVVI
ncbi:hypothetical protein RI697_15555 (plasmid) [Clavibacter michiganensis]|uniref:hypothetical protein n=1 Tax=Clavibacter michiganensis TaxID=28447 RepID=UPI003DA06FAE